MSGFFIVIEISALQQLLSIEGTPTSDLINNCERCIRNTMPTELNIQSSFLIFEIKSVIENSPAVIETSINLLEIISSYAEEIHEFSMMLLYRKNDDVERVVTELKQDYFTKCKDYSLLIENSIYEAAGKPIAEAINGYQLLSLEEHSDTELSNQNLEKLIGKNDVGRIVKILVPELSIEEDVTRIILSGSSELVIRLNLERAVVEASGKAGASVVYINLLKDEKDIIMPFARSIDYQLLSSIENYLEGVELKSWLNSKQRLNQINSDYSAEFFFSSYCLYLKGVLKSYQQALLPQVIVFTGLNHKAGKFIKYASRIIEYIENDCNPYLFFIEQYGSDVFPYSESEFFKHAVKKQCCGRIEPPEGIKRLNYHQTRLLYILQLTEGLFERTVLDTFLTGFGYTALEISSGINFLVEEGCLVKGRFLRIIKSSEHKSLHEMVKDEDEILRAFAGFIAENTYNKCFTDFGLAVAKLSDFMNDEVVSRAVYLCLTRLLDLGQTDFIQDFLEDNTGLSSDLSEALKLRACLIENDKAGCLKIMQLVPEKIESPENLNSALLLFEISRYFHAVNDYQRALDCIKKVLIFLQSGDYPGLEGAAFIELGFLMLCKGKLLESSEYLSLALEKLGNSGDVFNLMKAHLFNALQQYLWGSIDNALISAEKALNIAGENGFVEWNFLADFFICRMYFELGRYYDAEKKLSDCLCRSEIYRDDNRRKIFSAWIARSCVYQGKIYRGINMLLSLEEDPEVLFFLAEAYYFNGNMEKAVDSIERSGSSDEYFNLGFMSLEYISWKNGFNSIEGRVLRSEKGTGVLFHNIRAFYAFLLGMSGNREYGAEILFSLTRDEKISENDPYNKLYFHFYCQLLERRQDVDVVDKLTLMSKALKYLQQTSSRITSPLVRQQFMTKNYWNYNLVSEARKEKLI